MAYLYNINAWEYIKDVKDNAFDCIVTDPPYDMREFFMGELIRVCKGNIVMFSSPEKPFFNPNERAYWIKTPSTKNYSKHIGKFVEIILIMRQGNTFNTDLHWSNYTGVYTDLVEQNTLHPWAKPMSLIKRLISIYSKVGDVIFDPFFGSGTSIIAAEELGRKAYGCEIDKNHFKRLDNVYGQ